MKNKIIYYCWFGKSEKPKEIEKLILSWKKNFPLYDILEINESNFNINEYKYARSAYKYKKYAFVADCARIYYLNTFGGIYLDTDVEILKNPIKFHLYDLLLSQEKYYFETTGINTSIIISKSNLYIWKDLLFYYKNNYFDINNIQTINSIINNLFKKTSYIQKKDTFQIFKYKNDKIRVIPSKYLMRKTSKSYAIHYMRNSWGERLSLYRKTRRLLGQLLKQLIGEKLFNKLWK